MNVTPVHPRATHVNPRLRRNVVAVLAVAGAVLATATVVARPAPVAPPSSPMSIALSRAHTESLVGRLANAGEDTGPGCAESEVARLPTTSP